MRRSIEWQWETLDEHNTRIKVIGGWLVHHISYNENKKHFSESMCFIPDRDHEWHILPPFVDTKKAEAKALASEFASK